MYSPFFSTIFIFLRGGPNSITKLNGGAMAGLAPPGSATDAGRQLRSSDVNLMAQPRTHRCGVAHYDILSGFLYSVRFVEGLGLGH